MAWVRIDDHFDEHPKLQRVGPVAWGYWVAGIAYCNRNLTDGFIPWNKARSLCSFEVVEDDGQIWELGRSSGYASENVTADWIIGLLIDAGLWEEVTNGNGRIEGYRIHDYPKYQPSKAEIEASRDELHRTRSDAGRRGAEARWQNGKPHGKTDGKPVTNDKQTDGPKPNPNTNPTAIPNGIALDTPPPPNKRSGYSAEFETWFGQYPPGRGSKKQAYDLWKRMTVEERQSALDVLPLFKAGGDWKRGYHPAPEVWLRGKRWENPPPEAVDEGLANYRAFMAGASEPPKLGARP